MIPDIYQLYSIENGWISLDETVKVGEKIQLILEDRKEIVEVVATKTGAFRVQPLNFNGCTDNDCKVFVYGREVKDFHTVDYEAIAMLNVSATQELAKENEALKKQIRKAEIEISTLKAQITRIDELERLIHQFQAEKQTVEN